MFSKFKKPMRCLSMDRDRAIPLSAIGLAMQVHVSPIILPWAQCAMQPKFFCNPAKLRSHSVAVMSGYPSCYRRFRTLTVKVIRDNELGSFGLCITDCKEWFARHTRNSLPVSQRQQSDAVPASKLDVFAGRPERSRDVELPYQSRCQRHAIAQPVP